MTRVAAVAVLLGLAVVSGCGSSGGSTAPTPASTASATHSGAAAIITYQLNATGATSFAQQFQMAAGVAGSPQTCAQFVGGGGGRFYQLLGGSPGSAFSLNLDIVPYTGPAAYITTTSQLEFDLSGGTYLPPLRATGEQGLKLTTRADGSGSFVISAWPDVNDHAKTESAVLSWTCENG